LSTTKATPAATTARHGGCKYDGRASSVQEKTWKLPIGCGRCISKLELARTKAAKAHSWNAAAQTTIARYDFRKARKSAFNLSFAL
jgi:hypothetical protein